VLAEQVSDARAVAFSRPDVVRPDAVEDDELGVVADSRTRAHGADQVVDLLTRAPRLPRAQPEPLVERPYALDDLPAEEDREGDRTVPEVVVGQRRGVALPRPGSASGGVLGAARQAVELGVAGEPLRHAAQQAGRVETVVVREGDEIGTELGKCNVPGAGQAARRAEADDLDAASFEHAHDAVVVVLVDEEHAHRRTPLPLDGVEECAQLVGPIHRRDDEVERRGPPGHRP